MGYKITFDSTMIPLWKDKSIIFRNITVKYNVDTVKEMIQKETKKKQKKQRIIGYLTFSKSKNETKEEEIEVDDNFTYLDLKIDEIDIFISPMKLLRSTLSIFYFYFYFNFIYIYIYIYIIKIII